MRQDASSAPQLSLFCHCHIDAASPDCQGPHPDPGPALGLGHTAVPPGTPVNLLPGRLGGRDAVISPSRRMISYQNDGKGCAMMVGEAGKTQVNMPQRAWIYARTAHSIRHAFAGMLPQARAARLRTRGGYEPAPAACPSPVPSTCWSTSGRSGTFLPAERPALFASVHRVLRPGGVSPSRSARCRRRPPAGTGH
jgi:hypothetical protein